MFQENREQHKNQHGKIQTKPFQTSKRVCVCVFSGIVQLYYVPYADPRRKQTHLIH